MKKHKTYISIDDTDEIAYHTSTGELCEKIREAVELKFGSTTAVTRHQLLLHEGIAYTSHNSSMCFTCEISKKNLLDIKKLIYKTLLQESAATASPAYCICIKDDIQELDELLVYGQNAKIKILTQKIASDMAKKQNIILESVNKEKASGIIGALASVALRLSGNDGRLRGKVLFEQGKFLANELLQYKQIDDIRVVDETPLIQTKVIIIKDYLKWILLNHKRTLLLKNFGDFYIPLNKEALSRY